jgi:hypothetical protein
MNTNQDPKNDLVLNEYPKIFSSKDGHYTTITQSIDGKRKVAGRIFRDYDPKTKKMTYVAKDHAGNILFPQAKDLYELKKLFTEHAKALAMAIPENSKEVKDKELDKTDRTEGLKALRDEESKKEKSKGREL